MTAASRQPYEERDATGPLSVYGQTKLAGDQAIIASGCPYIILRTTWVYDIRGKNFLRTVLRLAQREGRAAHCRRPIRCADLGTRSRRGDRHHPGDAAWNTRARPASGAPACSISLQAGAHRGRALRRRSWRTTMALRPADGSGEFGAPLKARRCRQSPLRSIRRRRGGRAIQCCPMPRCKLLSAL